MKIGFVIDDTLDKPDGVQQYVLTLGKWLSSQGHEVHYLAGYSTRKDLPHLHSLGKNIDVRFNQNRLSVPWSSSTASIKKLLAREQFDVLHVQMPYSPLLAGKIVKLAPAQTAVVATFHIIPFSVIERTGAHLLKLWQNRNLKRIDAVVSVSAPAQQFALSAMGISSQILPNVVDVQTFKQAKKLSNYNDGKVNVVFLGRLVERKGVLQLLRAVQLLHAKGQLDGMRVIICGKGPLEQELRSYVDNFHLGQHVYFEGYIEEADKPDYLATADIAVFPSLGGESFGIVLIEAMAAGSRAILAGNNEGYASVMWKHSDQLIDPKNNRQFAEKLSYFARNQAARRKAAAWQNEQVKQYDVTNVGKRLLTIYRSAIAKRST